MAGSDGGPDLCNWWSSFRITIFDTRTRGDNCKPQLERVVVAEE
ncbi:MAG: hypothetical protein WCF79_10010 [Rhodomicrobium sp.]